MQAKEGALTARAGWSVSGRLAAIASGVLLLAAASEARQGAGHDALVDLHGELRKARQVAVLDGVPDYSAGAMERRRAQVDALQRRLTAIDPRGWARAEQVDWLLVQSELNDLVFEHDVRRPWSRDPGLYVDLVTRIPFTRLPLPEDRLDAFRARLRAVPRIFEQARANLREGTRELWALALHNMEHHDGVGHGHPYREVPPDGTIGWFQDLARGLEKHHPALTEDARVALAASEEFRDWLKQRQPTVTEPSGVGRDNFNWYLKHVKRMPYDDRDVLTIGERELHRAQAFLALERHKNRDQPALDPSSSPEEYARRIEEADRHIRDFIREREILTIPEFIGRLDTNVPWIVRPGGRNFWEEIQYRDPRPDHLHAVIPGHRFDAQVSRRVTRPIRSTYADGGRSEGWGFYLEEMFLQAGLLDDRPRTRELFYVFQVKRAVRNRAELRMQTNEWTVPQAVRYMVGLTPYLDENVARVDAEIYLRRPPGYGISYQMGKLQMDQLLADRSRQLGERFVLRDFHDEFLALGTIPIALARYEMTGLDDEVRGMFEPPPALVASGR